MDVLQWARHYRNFPGQGQFDLENFFEQVLLSGYAGPLSLEIFNDHVPRDAEPAHRRRRDAFAALPREPGARAARARARRRGERRRASRGARCSASRCSIRRRRRPCDGFAFLEFARRRRAAEALGALLVQLGFRRAGRHRTQGGDAVPRRASIQPRRQRRARRRWRAPASTRRPVGLRARPGDAPTRARRPTAPRALLSARLRQPASAPHELQLPAIIAPGGTHRSTSCRRAGARGARRATSSPTPAQRGAAPTPACVAIDHVALGLAPDQLDTWILFAAAVLGLQPRRKPRARRPVRPDPLAAASPTPSGACASCSTSRSSQRTRTARPVSATGRAAAACSTSPSRSRDIFATVRAAARAKASRFVPISANYYDDLLARLDLDEALVRADAVARHPLRPLAPAANSSTPTPSPSPTASSSRSCSAGPTMATARSTPRRAWRRRNRTRRDEAMKVRA